MTAKLVIPVDIIIPVYGNLEVTKRCLESVHLSSLPPEATVYVINDCTPDQALREYCVDASARYGFNLIENSENLGFVVSANLGMSINPDHDIVLLNSDTEVYGSWVDRLASSAYGSDDIATVTPFSNNATICSYPNYPAGSSLPDLWKGHDLDQIMATANPNVTIELPTGVGFCLFIKRLCIEQIGLFDEAKFGRGYGEECDFCFRATARGWKHLLAANVFVYHEGSASFNQLTTELQAAAEKIIQELHPDYAQVIEEFVLNDPASEARGSADIARVFHKPQCASQVLGEQQERARALTQLCIEKHEIILSERSHRSELHNELASSLEKSAWLEKKVAEQQLELTSVRQSLAEASYITKSTQDEFSRYIESAQRELENYESQRQKLSQLLSDCRAQYSDVDAALDDATSQLKLIYSSKSWRFTAWIRRITRQS